MTDVKYLLLQNNSHNVTVSKQMRKSEQLEIEMFLMIKPYLHLNYVLILN